MINRKLRGFTLVELLVVMGVLATLIAGLVVLINPVDRQRQANDTAVMQAMGQVAGSVLSYSAANGAYPAAATYAALTAIVVPSELTAAPTLPTSSNYAPTYVGTATTGRLTVRLYSNRSAATCSNAGTANPNAWFTWDVTNAKSCIQCNNSTTTAPVAVCT